MERPAIADYPPGAQMPPRVLGDFEFVWMVAGNARVTLDDDELPLGPGQLLFVPPGVRHGFLWDTTNVCRHGYVHFGPRCFEGSLPAKLELRPMTADDPLAGLCAYLLWLAGAEPDDWQRRSSDTLAFMLRLFVGGPLPGPDTPAGLAPALAGAVLRLQQEWAHMPLRRIGVGELARRAHVSRGYLNRLFRAGFGLSAAAALERARCARAESLLLRTDLTVESIAHQCGFADPSHFSHRFKAIHGASPRAYRTAGTTRSSELDHAGVRRLSHLIWS
ncbi:MAG: helix-turn-helix domain-containing protein [Acidimicrobiales bacterium]